MVGWTLDELGRGTSINVPGSGSIGRSFDALDRITSLSLDGSPIATFAFRGPSRIDTVTRSTGVLTSAQYDGDRRLTNLSTTSLGTPLSFLGTYDDRHLLTSEDRGGIGDAFTYDHASRLLQAGLDQPNPAGGVNLGGDHLATTLDPADNWAIVDKAFGGATANNTVTPNTRNQYPSFSASQTFDPQGNLTGNLSGTFHYDFKNRLARADLASGATLSFAYDPDNRLIRKTTSLSGTTSTEETVWEGWEPISHFVNGTQTEMDASLGAPDSLIAYRTRSQDGSTHVFNLHSDLKGDTAGVTDETGLLVERYRYTPYGEVIATDQDGNVVTSTRTSRLFQGLTYDRELGFYYARNRFYDPQEGRFVTQDPLGLEAGVNLYAFSGDEPVEGRDTMGLMGYTPNGGANPLRNQLDEPYDANNSFETFDAIARDVIGNTVTDILQLDKFADAVSVAGESSRAAGRRAVAAGTALGIAAIDTVGGEVLGTLGKALLRIPGARGLVARAAESTVGRFLARDVGSFFAREAETTVAEVAPKVITDPRRLLGPARSLRETIGQDYVYREMSDMELAEAEVRGYIDAGGRAERELYFQLERPTGPRENFGASSLPYPWVQRYGYVEIPVENLANLEFNFLRPVGPEGPHFAFPGNPNLQGRSLESYLRAWPADLRGGNTELMGTIRGSQRINLTGARAYRYLVNPSRIH